MEIWTNFCRFDQVVGSVPVRDPVMPPYPSKTESDVRDDHGGGSGPRIEFLHIMQQKWIIQDHHMW